jgi:hypothetical protein
MTSQKGSLASPLSDKIIEKSDQGKVLVPKATGKPFPQPEKLNWKNQIPKNYNTSKNILSPQKPITVEIPFAKCRFNFDGKILSEGTYSIKIDIFEF